jgi:5'-3' exonuclease
MGIQYLNSYMKNNTTSKSIFKISFDELRDKVIAIDISIYLYKFSNDGLLIVNIYNMLSIFTYYNINAIFVFDGKAPPEKKLLLDKREEEKVRAKVKYKELEDNLKNSMDLEKQDITEQMISLKKKFIKLKHNDIQKVKQLISAFGFSYIQPDCEADLICAKMVVKKIAYACLSEDMDMFLYGCNRVLRYLSLINHSVIMYNLKNILIDLKLSFKEFKEICVISGTDYNIDNNKINFYDALNLYNKFKATNYYDFYEWLDSNTEYIDNIYVLYNIYNMFLTENIVLNDYSIKLKKKEINYNMIKNIMIPEGFIFI